METTPFVIVVISSLACTFCNGELFPYGPSQGDTNLTRGPQANSGEIPLDTRFNFFGKEYGSLYVSVNGHVSFEHEVTDFSDDTFPLNNVVIIAPFWADASTDKMGAHGNVTYRQINTRTSQTNELFERANGIFRNVFFDHQPFNSTWMFIATWDKVAYLEPPDLSQLNTFQCVLATDGASSGVIFLYDDITWYTAGPPAGGAKPAQVGFNAGDGLNYYVIENSGKAEIVDIETTSNIEEDGVWVFRVDQANITETPTDDPVEVPCPSFSVANGIVTSNGNYTGDMAVVSCDRYFELRGTHSLTCLSNGSWSDPLPTCQLKACKNFSIANGTVRSSGSYPGDSAEVECESAFQLLGSHVLSCLPNGTWSEPIPFCQPRVSCQKISVANGTVITNGSYAGDFAEVVCESGFKLRGSQLLTCLTNGTWSDPVPSCQPKVTCREVLIEHGNVTFNSTPIYSGSSASVVCDNCFGLEGAQTLTCLPNGTWSDSTPTCKAKEPRCPLPSPPSDGIITTQLTACPPTLQLTFSCNTGYQLDGQATVNCSGDDDQWTSSFPTCYLVTPEPDELFPYGPDVGDTKLKCKSSDAISDEVTLKNNFTFFNVRYNSLFVSVNGYISFESQFAGEFSEDPFPMDDVVIVAPFWADASTDPDFGYGDVMYREITPLANNTELFKRVNDVFTNIYFDQHPFNATWMLIATWENVTYNMPPDLSQRNTYQCILTTDGEFSGVMFIYDDINWYTAGAPEEGAVPVQIGFNAGDGENYYLIEKSGTSDILNIEMTSNINETGVWAFRVDKAEIEEAPVEDPVTCQEFFVEHGKVTYSNTPSIVGDSASVECDVCFELHGVQTLNCSSNGTWSDSAPTCKTKEIDRVNLEPTVVSMYGGSSVTISGTCFNASIDDVRCDFGGKIVHGIVLSRSEAACVTPSLFTQGFVKVRVSQDGGISFPLQGGLSVVGDLKALVTFKKWNALPNSSLSMTWNPELLPGVESIDIVVFEFNQSENAESFLWRRVHTLAYATANSAGRFDFVNIPIPRSSYLANPRAGAIGIVEADSSDVSLENRTIWSKVHPLNWLYPVNTQKWCQEWANQQKSNQEWLDKRPPCPCMERHARHDKGAFTLFLDCKEARNSEECTARPGATFCVAANQPSPNGAGQECCYDGSGYLIESDAVGIGYAQRWHNRVNSASWTTGSGPVPLLSHYLSDTMPYLQCCGESSDRQRSDGNTCGLYRGVRPSRSCYGYSSPQLAAAFGDPHFISFDGFNYTFNGYGEFTLGDFNNGEFILQARSLPMLESPNATVFTAMSTRINTSDVIHVETHQESGIDVFVRREGMTYKSLDMDASRTWHLQGASIQKRNNSKVEQMSVIFDNGIGIEFTALEGALTAMVTAPERFKGTTKGMLGTWNDDNMDDLLRPDDVIMPPNSSMVTIFNDFGMKWEVRANDSLFYYRTGYSQSAYTNDSYRPSLILPERPLDGRGRDVCGDDDMCAFDWLTTRNEEFATLTRTFITDVNSAKEDIIPVTCQSFNVANGSVHLTGSSPGDTATVRCDRCFELSDTRRDQSFTCTSNGSWSWPNPTCEPIELTCQAPPHIANGKMKIVSNRCPPSLSISISCDTGFKLIGQSRIDCSRATGQWLQSIPTCQEKNRPKESSTPSLPPISPTRKAIELEGGKTDSSSSPNSPVSMTKFVAIAAGLGILIVAVCITALCYVTTERYKRRKYDMRRRASSKMYITQNPVYDPDTGVGADPIA